MISTLRSKLHIIFVIPIIAVSIISISCAKATEHTMPQTDSLINIPLGGNAWRVDKDTLGGNISNDGIVNWSDAKADFIAYVRFGHTGKFKLYLNIAVPNGESKIAVSTLGSTKEIKVNNNLSKTYYAGEWTVKDTGYVAIKIHGVNKTGDLFANISSIQLSGNVIDNKTAYVKNNDDNFFHWGRRGPSVHLNYNTPDNVNAEWFYNEVTVPQGNDVLGSYFMADGFGEGYFGMQVNSPTERHILFSVWSPFNTDNPEAIPADQKINLLKKGENVHIGEFGNEGAGGQSYLNYMWKAGNTYRFLLHAKPEGQDRTTYTAYFYAPELGKWQLIASFSRPKTTTYLNHLYSFLENFEPEQGTITRSVQFNNQWIYDTNSNWHELNKAHFTCDNTGAKGYRMDYAGGLEGNAFYLKDCGFFNNYTPRNGNFERPLQHQTPDIDFSKLP